MDKRKKFSLVFSTVSSQEEGTKIAEKLVGEGLAACVNVVPSVVSVYEWKGEIERAGEALLIIKSIAEKVGDLMRRLKELHSYEVPEIISLPIEDGYKPYLDWIVSVVGKSKEE